MKNVRILIDKSNINVTIAAGREKRQIIDV